MDSRIIGGLVGGLGLMAAGAVAVVYVMNPVADYADLVPAPDSIIWEEGQETPLWLSTNRHAVDLRVDNIALGLGEIDLRDPASGQVSVLGEGLGCLDAVVSGLVVETVSATEVALGVTLHKEAGVSATLYYQFYADGEARYSDPQTYTVTGSTATLRPSGAGVGLAEGVAYRADVSTNSHLPRAITRSVTWTGGDEDSGTSDVREEEIHLVEGTGVALIACAEAEDVAVTLHGDAGAELNRYLVDVLPEPTAVPATATPVANPVFDPAYTSLRFCPDSATPPAMQLSGGETVGTVTATGTGTLAYALAPDGESRDFAFFEIDSGTGGISVSDAGADDHTGIDGTRLYTFVVNATDDAGRAGEALVAVQVDLSNPTTAGDGVCT